MKKCLLLICLATTLANAQNKQLLHGFNEIPQSSYLNPAIQPAYKSFFGFPLLSHIHVQAGSSGVSAYDIFVDDNRAFGDKLEAALLSMDPQDFFLVNQQLDIFSGGFQIGNPQIEQKYITFGMYQEADIISYFPRDLVVLALDGNQNNIDRTFDLGQLNVAAEMISVIHAGYSTKVSDQLTLGIRGKIYSSIFNVRSTRNTGSFVTNQGVNNFLIHRFNLDMRAQTSGIASLVDDENSDPAEDISAIGKRFFLGGNLGLGVDLGLNYAINKQWQVAASLIDLGFIRHSKDVRNYVLDGSLVFEGINPIFPETGQGQSAEEYWEEVQEDFEELFDIEETNDKYTSLRPLKFFGGVTYSYGQKVAKDCNCLVGEEPYRNALAFQVFVIKRPLRPVVATTISYSKLLAGSWRIKASYTIDSFSLTNLGLGTSFRLGPLQFYALADNLLQYNNLAKAQNVSLQLGFNYVIARKQ